MPGPPTNIDVAEAFTLLADLLDVEAADRHRILAYRRAADAIRGLDADVVALARAGRATDIPGVGATLQSKILELADTGDIAALARLRARVPPGLAEIARLHGVGGARARAIRETLGVEGIDDLRLAAAAGELERVRGIGPALRAGILAQLGVTPPAAP
ncbi:MAG: helix-hairpin-helix domain-containing protein [Actinomycetota bacterium]